MVLSELKKQVDFLCDTGHSGNPVLVTLSESSVGSRAATGIIGIHSGIDWEHGQVRISTEKKIISYEKDRDNAIEPRREDYDIGTRVRHLFYRLQLWLWRFGSKQDYQKGYSSADYSWENGGYFREIKARFQDFMGGKNMYKVKRAISDFNRHYSDKKVAKRVMNKIRYNIVNHIYNQNSVGTWFDGLTKGTIKILQDNGYIIRKSASKSNQYAVLFKESDVGLSLDE